MLMNGMLYETVHDCSTLVEADQADDPRNVALLNATYCIRICSFVMKLLSVKQPSLAVGLTNNSFNLQFSMAI